MKKALITGITGQDGSYLAEFLLNKGYHVAGIVRRSSVNNLSRLSAIQQHIQLEHGDMTDPVSLHRVIDRVRPDEIYNLAAQSDVHVSFQEPAYTCMVNAQGVANLLETTRLLIPHARIYQASSSEMFGNSMDNDGYQRETTPMQPVSPYGAAKAFAYNLTGVYRQSYNMFVTNGILFNHESPRRGDNFVTAKIIRAAVEIKQGQRQELPLGNLDAYRDWGHARDYVEAMWLMMQQPTAQDYVCATGVSHSVQDLIEYVFGNLGLDWRRYITQDPAFFRDTELHQLRGDSSRLRNDTGWEPTVDFFALLDEMIDHWQRELHA